MLKNSPDKTFFFKVLPMNDDFFSTEKYFSGLNPVRSLDLNLCPFFKFPMNANPLLELFRPSFSHF